jgi:hypothetical protein
MKLHDLMVVLIAGIAVSLADGDGSSRAAGPPHAGRTSLTSSTCALHGGGDAIDAEEQQSAQGSAFLLT